LTTYSGVIGSGPPGSWRGGGKETAKEFPTEQEAEAAAGKKVKELVTKGYTELCRPRRATGRGGDSTAAAWQRIEAWFCRHAPANNDFPLAAGSSSEVLGKLEDQIGQRLPADFRAAYKRHNGSNRVKVFGIFALGYWMPLFRPTQLKGLFNGVADEWQAMTDMLRDGAFDELGSTDRPKGPIKAEHWNPGWVPFTCDDSGDFLCIDLDPPQSGTRGQVIFWWHEYGPYTVVAKSFGELLHRLAVKLDRAAYAFSEERELSPTQPVVRNFDQLLAFFKKGKAEPGAEADGGHDPGSL
jgi:cell wall assembly regulator SMI1